jgi:alkanesulfonate monooxygenase SsuD/methylene tetrahydromethanopterin reductase-like flavin-dependent oxidoreductase (luciferase family)
VKGYEAYASGQGSGTAIKTDDGRRKIGTGSAYDKSNLLVGTPETILERIRVGQAACSFSEITVHAMGETLDQAETSLRLFAEQVLPEVHKMPAPLNADALPRMEVA